MSIATAAVDKLARDVSGKVVPSKGYSRIVVGGRTLAYVNPTHLDFRADAVSKAPAAARETLTIKGNRAKLPLTEKRAAASLLRHVAKQ